MHKTFILHQLKCSMFEPFQHLGKLFIVHREILADCFSINTQLSANLGFVQVIFEKILNFVVHSNFFKLCLHSLRFFVLQLKTTKALSFLINYLENLFSPKSGESYLRKYGESYFPFTHGHSLFRKCHGF